MEQVIRDLNDAEASAAIITSKLQPPHVWRGTGMIASSSTFRPHPGRVIRDLFRLLDLLRHCTEALVYSNHPRDPRIWP